MVASATTYSGKVARMVHVFSDEGLAKYAEHCYQDKWKNRNEKQQNIKEKDNYFQNKSNYKKGAVSKKERKK